MGIFDDLDQAQSFERSQYFQQGRYLVDILRIKFNTGGFKGQSFVIEAQVLGVSSNKESAPTPGATAAHVWNASKNPELARATWMQFLTTIAGREQAALTAAQWAKLSNQAIGDGQPFAGTKMVLEVFDVTTKVGKPFTKHVWQRVATAEDFAEFGLQAA